jgi:hypothetical protein
MYELTLTHGERAAIDWIGNRYSHGDDLFRLLMEAEQVGDDDWDSPNDILFRMDEPLAWEVKEIISGPMECFGPELWDKLRDLSDRIV